jgi:hypothetical protein
MRRKEKQYKIRWKGYSPAYDTWEPAANVHAPELIRNFLKKKRERDKNPTMSDENLPTHLNLIAMNPETTSHSSTPPSPSSLNTFLHMAEQAGLTVTDAQAAAIAGVMDQPDPAEHPDMTDEPLEPQDVPAPGSPMYQPHSPTPESSRATMPDTPILLYPGPTPVHHSEVNVDPNMPGWPWMNRRRYPSTASLPYRLADHEEPQLLDYVRLTLDSITRQPTTVSTTGIGQPQYAAHLFAQPAPKDPNDPIAEDLWRESPLGGTSAFDPVLNKAIWVLRDGGVWADILRLRTEDARAPEFRAWDERVKRLEDFALAERRAYCSAKDQSWVKRSGASNRLIAARATTRILSICGTRDGCLYEYAPDKAHLHFHAARPTSNPLVPFAISKGIRPPIVKTPTSSALPRCRATAGSTRATTTTRNITPP